MLLFAFYFLQFKLLNYFLKALMHSFWHVILPSQLLQRIFLLMQIIQLIIHFTSLNFLDFKHQLELHWQQHRELILCFSFQCKDKLDIAMEVHMDNKQLVQDLNLHILDIPLNVDMDMLHYILQFISLTLQTFILILKNIPATIILLIYYISFL